MDRDSTEKSKQSELTAPEVVGSIFSVLAGLWMVSFLWHVGPHLLDPQTGGLDMAWWAIPYYLTTLAVCVGMACGLYDAFYEAWESLK